MTAMGDLPCALRGAGGHSSAAPHPGLLADRSPPQSEPCSLFFKREMELSLIGLQNAGKSSLVNVLTTGSFHEDMIPTVSALAGRQPEAAAAAAATVGARRVAAQCNASAAVAAAAESQQGGRPAEAAAACTCDAALTPRHAA